MSVFLYSSYMISYVLLLCTNGNKELKYVCVCVIYLGWQGLYESLYVCVYVCVCELVYVCKCVCSDVYPDHTKKRNYTGTAP